MKLKKPSPEIFADAPVMIQLLKPLKMLQKNKAMKKEGNEPVMKCHRLKKKATLGKMRETDVVIIKNQ